MPLPRAVYRALLCWPLAVPALTTFARPAIAEEDQKGQARKHYARGVELANAGSYEPALAEFTRAYELSPHYAVLYNIGQAEVALGRPAKALDAFERYLSLGAANVDPERRREVEAQIAALKADATSPKAVPDQSPPATAAKTAANSAGFLAVRCSVSGVSIAVDGAAAGVTPLGGPLALAAGSHRVTFSGAGHEPGSLEVRIAADQTITVDCGMKPLEPAAAESRSSGTRTLGYVLGGVGIGLGAAAIAHWRWNGGRFEDWETAYGDYRENPTPGAHAAINEQAESIERASAVSVGLGVAAALSFGAGVLLLITGGDSTESTTSRASVCAPPGLGFCSRF